MLEQLMNFFSARTTSCVLSMDCDEQFEKLAIFLERIAPANEYFERIARVIRRDDNIF